MKRIAGILIALCMLVSFACSVFAEQVPAEEQLQFFFDNLRQFRMTEEDAKLNESWTVTDLDHDGYLELLLTAVDETDSCRILRGWTYREDKQGVVGFEAQLPQDVYNQSVLENSAETRYNPDSDTWSYLISSELKLTQDDIYFFRCFFSLKDGAFIYQTLPTEHDVTLNGVTETSWLDQSGTMVASASQGDPAAAVLIGERRNDTNFRWLCLPDITALSVLSESYAVFAAEETAASFPAPQTPAVPAAPETPVIPETVYYQTPAPAFSPDGVHDPMYDSILGAPSYQTPDAPQQTTDPSLTKDPMYANVTPVFTPVPVPTEPQHIDLMVTRNPTNENRKPGSTANFVANANIRDSMKWVFVSPGGSECSAQEFNALFPASSVSGVYDGVLSVSNVTDEMNGWGAYAIFYYQDQIASSTVGYICIN